MDDQKKETLSDVVGGLYLGTGIGSKIEDLHDFSYSLPGMLGEVTQNIQDPGDYLSWVTGGAGALLLYGVSKLEVPEGESTKINELPTWAKISVVGMATALGWISGSMIEDAFAAPEYVDSVVAAASALGSMLATYLPDRKE